MSQVAATHDNTASSRKNRAIEADLMRSLNTIVNSIKNKINPKFAWTELAQLKPLYENMVYDTIREGVTRSFVLGGEFAAASISTKIPVFITESDTRTIKQITEENVAKFWGRMQISTSRGVDRMFNTINRDAEPPDSFLNPNYIVNSIAISVTTVALNLGTVKKTAELIDKYRIAGNSASLTSAVKQRGLVQSTLLSRAVEIPTDILELESLTNSLLLELNPDVMMLVQDILTWITANDERVCPQCMSLEGRTFPLDDPNMLIPNIDTHNNCRCRVMPGLGQEL
jgi:hypothetical protein